MPRRSKIISAGTKDVSITIVDDVLAMLDERGIPYRVSDSSNLLDTRVSVPEEYDYILDDVISVVRQIHKPSRRIS